MPCEAHLHIFSIKSIFLLKNVTIHENSIKGLKIPRAPAVPVQARLRVPEQKKPSQTCLRRFFFVSQASHPPAGQDRSRERKTSRLPRLVPGIVQARAQPGINTRWPRKRPPPDRCRHADAVCRKGCPASPARPRPAEPAWSNVTRRAASRSPPNDKCPPLRG